MFWEILFSEEIPMRTIIALAVVILWSFSGILIADAQNRRGTGFSGWSAPTNIGPPINTQWDDNVPVLSSDEKTIYFTSTRPGSVPRTGSTDGSEDIWVATRQNRNARWNTPVNLGSRINSEYTERMRSISDDGRVILFQSDRPTGYGGSDVWAIVRKHTNNDFDWSEPVNLGPVINSQYNEVAAKYLFHGRHARGDLFFSSTRPTGFGGADIYESEITEGGFGLPVNLVELNTASLEACFWVRKDGREIIFSTNRPNLTGDFNLYDLWVATRSSVYDSWSEPESLGPIVNSEGYLDVNPMLASEDRALYFSSSRPNPHGPTGNMDIYLSVRTKLR